MDTREFDYNSATDKWIAEQVRAAKLAAIDASIGVRDFELGFRAQLMGSTSFVALDVFRAAVDSLTLNLLKGGV